MITGHRPTRQKYIGELAVLTGHRASEASKLSTIAICFFIQSHCQRIYYDIERNILDIVEDCLATGYIPCNMALTSFNTMLP